MVSRRLSLALGLILSALLLPAHPVAGQTRFYFPLDTAADVSPSFDASWVASGQAVSRKAVTTKGSSAITAGTLITVTSGANNNALDRQYVSDPLNGAQTISGTVKGTALMLEGAGADNLNRVYLSVRVVSQDGSSVTCTPLSLSFYGVVAEYNTSFRNKRIADGDTITTCNANDGDRIVIEIGHGLSSSGTTPQGQTKWGENATDCTDNETGTTDCAGFFEFTDVTLSFQTGGGGGGTFSRLPLTGAGK
jgi:hypothetical protein